MWLIWRFYHKHQRSWISREGPSSYLVLAGVVHSLKDISMTSSPLSKLSRLSSDVGCFSMSTDDIDCFPLPGDVSMFFDVAVVWLMLLLVVDDVANRLSHRRRSYAILLAIFLKPILVPVNGGCCLVKNMLRQVKLTRNSLESNTVEWESRQFADFNFPLH